METESDSTREQSGSLAPYVRDERLLSYPRKWERRMEILRWLARAFEPGRFYTEGEVNQLLSGHEIDHVTLRRYLIDAQLLARGQGRYWSHSGVGAIPDEID